LATAAVLAAMGCQTQAPRDPEVVELTIPRGATLTAVAETLAARQLIGSPGLFKFYATMSGRHRAIQAGTYHVPRGATHRQLLTMLVAGRPAYRWLLVPEGLMLGEVAAAVEAQLGIPADSVLAAARDSGLRVRLGIPTPTLEGYLYPNRYAVLTNAGATEVVGQMVTEFEGRWRAEWNARLDSLDMTRHELVTLASIIEGEVRHAPDRPYVSSVYHNRLRRLFERDYQIRSPYNTYLIDGLPPGPIGEPSEASIEAALYPAQTDFLYFVARPDGQHIFSRTYREHQRAVREVQRAGTG
jgi:UPF0755 protein